MIRSWFMHLFVPRSTTLRSWALRELHEHGPSCTTFCQLTATVANVHVQNDGALMLTLTDVQGVSQALDGDPPKTLCVPANLVDLETLRPKLVPHKRIVVEVNPKSWTVNRFIAIEWRLQELKGHVISWCQRTDSIEVYVHTHNDKTHDPLDPFIVPATMDAYTRFQGFLEHCVSAESNANAARTEVDMMVRRGSLVVQAVRYRQLTEQDAHDEQAQKRDDTFMKVTFRPPRVKWSNAGTTLMSLSKRASKSNASMTK